MASANDHRAYADNPCEARCGLPCKVEDREIVRELSQLLACATRLFRWNRRRCALVVAVLRGRGRR